MTGRLHGCCCSKVGIICSENDFNKPTSPTATQSSPFDRFSTIYDDSEVVRVYDEESLKACEIVFFGLVNLGATQASQGVAGSSQSSITRTGFTASDQACKDYIKNGGKVICISDRTSASPVIDSANALSQVQGNTALSTNLTQLKQGVEYFGAVDYYAKKDIFQTALNFPAPVTTQVILEQVLDDTSNTQQVSVSAGSLPWDPNAYTIYPVGYGDAFRVHNSLDNPVVQIGSMTQWILKPTAQAAILGYCNNPVCLESTTYTIGQGNTGPFSYQKRDKGFIVILSDAHLFLGNLTLPNISTATQLLNKPFLKSLLNPCLSC